MLNYFKSECYRVSRMKSVYYLIIAFSVAACLLNVVLWWFGNHESYFPYNTTSFSFANVISSAMLFPIMAYVIAALLYLEGKNNGTLKNTVAFGIPQGKMFIAESLTVMITGTIAMVIIVGLYIVSAVLLLRNEGPFQWMTVVREMLAVYWIAVAGGLSMVLGIHYFKKSWTSAWVWIIVWFVVPKGLQLLGLRIPFIKKLADWLPSNFFSENVQVRLLSGDVVWDHFSGMVQTVMIGIVGTVIFLILGILLLRKRDL